jgi:hypothetical protein
MEILQLLWWRRGPLVSSPHLNSEVHLPTKLPQLKCQWTHSAIFSVSVVETNPRLTAHLELRNSTSDSQLNSSLEQLSTNRIRNKVSNNSSLVAWVSVTAETCLPSRWLAMDVSSGSIIPASRRHVTVYTRISVFLEVQALGPYLIKCCYVLPPHLRVSKYLYSNAIGGKC